MKNFFKIAAIFLAFGLAAAFASCSNASGGGDAPAPSPAPTPTYTVTFNSNGGSDVTSQTVTSGQTATKPSDPSKDHFNFVEWCSDQACQTAFDFATPITDDITLYAKWSSLPVYVVTFVLNGGKYGSSDTYTQNVESGSKAVRPSSDPTKDDTVSGDVTTKYAFENWYADAGCGTLFDFDATTISGPTTIYAKWSESIFYTVTFELNGGKYGTSGTYTQSVLNGSKVTRPASNPTKDDNVSAAVTIKYTLDNWYADSEFGALFDFNTTTISGPTTVYAKWNEVECYDVIILSGIEHGEVTSDAEGRIAVGSFVTLVASPNPNYELDSYSVTYANSNIEPDENGRFIMPASPVIVSATFRQIPLTLEAIEAGAKVTFDNSSLCSVTYIVNRGESKIIGKNKTQEIILDNIGDKVCFYGDNITYLGCKINCDKDCYIYGNIMSLIDSADYENAKTIPSTGFASNQGNFEELFFGNVHIKNKPNAKLLLPATTLRQGCYMRMFAGCKGLTSAPELPATTLAEDCYRGMFSGCTSFTSTPELPATTLAKSCYYSMFSGCKSLTSTPELPATTLEEQCYAYMFARCTSLTNPPELQATTLAKSCYDSMFEECTSLTISPKLPATTLEEECYSFMFNGCTSLVIAQDMSATTCAKKSCYYMFQDCTSLTKAPALPATTLADECYLGMFRQCYSLEISPVLPAPMLAFGCYEFMFFSCHKLANVTCLATNKSAEECTYEWLIGVSNSGTFKRTAGSQWSSGKNGAPNGWTVVDYQE